VIIGDNDPDLVHAVRRSRYLLLFAQRHIHSKSAPRLVSSTVVDGNAAWPSRLGLWKPLKPVLSTRRSIHGSGVGVTCLLWLEVPKRAD
jgi:hypothetical protein